MVNFKTALLIAMASLLVCGAIGFDQVSADELKPWEKMQRHFEAESIALFQVILKEQHEDDKRKLSPCEIRAEWLDYSVPHYLAEEYFGLKIPADISPSYRPGELPKILDPNGDMRETFCTKKQDDEKRQSLLERLKKGELKKEQEPGESLKSLENRRLEYTIPIFDRRYQRAVVIGNAQNSRWWVQMDGRVRSYFDLGVWASIYVKRKGRWQLLKHEPIASGHGGT
jgi:hypothetical protein